MSKKIYVITRGAYSDYCIDRVFSKEKLAKEYLEGKSDDYRMEKYDLDKPIPERKTEVWMVSLELDTKEIIHCRPVLNAKVKDTVRYSVFGIYKTETLDFTVEADGRTRAVKIASERYGQVIAEEMIRFPYLRQRIIRGYHSFNGNRYSLDGDLYFPTYDFKTSEILLRRDEEFDDSFLTYDIESYDESKLAEYLPKGVTFRKIYND